MATIEQDSERGPLFDLQRLQEKADRLNTESQAVVREKMKLADLQNKVKQLRQKRDELQERLRRGPHEIIQEYLQKGKGKQLIRRHSEIEREVIVNAVLSLQKRKLIDLCEAYRLTGISLASQEAKRSCFRCETFFDSRYYEPYYIEIELKDTLEICKHTIPYFIPIDVLGEQYLNSDIKKFFMVITEYLNAFVARREQVHLCQEHHSDKLDMKELSCSPAYDFVQLTTKASDEQETGFVVKLSYDKLMLSLPSSVELGGLGKETTSQQSLYAKKKLFQDHHLTIAFAKAFS